MSIWMRVYNRQKLWRNGFSSDRRLKTKRDMSAAYIRNAGGFGSLWRFISKCFFSIRFMKSAVCNSDDELANIQNKDRLLPSQPYFSKMYRGFDFYGDMELLLSSMYEPLNLNIKTKDGMTYAVMGSDLNTLRFYQFFNSLTWV